MTEKERMVAIMRGGGFSNYPELADLLIADGCGYNKSFNYTATINEQEQELIRRISYDGLIVLKALRLACEDLQFFDYGEEKYEDGVEMKANYFIKKAKESLEGENDKK